MVAHPRGNWKPMVDCHFARAAVGQLIDLSLRNQKGEVNGKWIKGRRVGKYIRIRRKKLQSNGE